MMSKKIISVGLVTVLLIGLAGCVNDDNLNSQLDENRYKTIKEIVIKSNFDNLGNVESKEYDKGSGFLQASWIRFELSGDAAFETLKNNIRAIDGVECENVPKRLSLDCLLGSAQINVTLIDGNTTLTVNDPSNGKINYD